MIPLNKAVASRWIRKSGWKAPQGAPPPEKKEAIRISFGIAETLITHVIKQILGPLGADCGIAGNGTGLLANLIIASTRSR